MLSLALAAFSNIQNAVDAIYEERDPSVPTEANDPGVAICCSAAMVTARQQREREKARSGTPLALDFPHRPQQTRWQERAGSIPSWSPPQAL